MFRSYIKNFIRFNKTNEIGNTLLIVAVAFDLVFIFIASSTFLLTGSVNLGWWAFLPIMLTVMAVTHLVVRPIVSAHYASK